MRCMKCPEIIRCGLYCPKCEAIHAKRARSYAPALPPREAVAEPIQYADGEPRSTGNVFCWKGGDSIFYSSAQAERQAKLREASERNSKK